MSVRPWRRRKEIAFARLLRSRGGGSRAFGGALSIVAHAGAIGLVVASAGRASPAELRPIGVARDTVLYFVTTTAVNEDASGGPAAVGDRVSRRPRAMVGVYRTNCVFPVPAPPDWPRLAIADPPPPPPDSLAARGRSAAPSVDVPTGGPVSSDEPFISEALDCWSQVLARPSHLHYTEGQP